MPVSMCVKCGEPIEVSQNMFDWCDGCLVCDACPDPGFDEGPCETCGKEDCNGECCQCKYCVERRKNAEKV